MASDNILGKRQRKIMKRILIAGANSYIGTSVEAYLNGFSGEYTIDTVDLKEESWRKKSFSGYDVVFFVAGIAHIKETKKNASLYYKVNRDLAIEAAEKSKRSGVRQFIILSSMNVYGMVTGYITKDTVPKPASHYGRSKLEADEYILKLASDDFTVAILRPPMVYGKGCKGNYQRLRKFACRFVIFPQYINERSMIYITNLCEFIKSVIDQKKGDIFFPQNAEYVCTSEMVKKIALSHGKPCYQIRIWNPIIKRLPGTLIQKVFGSLIYEKKDLVDGIGFEESIELSEEWELK